MGVRQSAIKDRRISHQEILLSPKRAFLFPLP